MEKRSCCCSWGRRGNEHKYGNRRRSGRKRGSCGCRDDDTVCHCRHKHRTEKEEKDLLNRLSRIEGQVRGIKAMVQDERYCPDILVRIGGAVCTEWLLQGPAVKSISKSVWWKISGMGMRRLRWQSSVRRSRR